MENKKPTLSICIPTYNRAEKLKKSLGIICNQLNEIECNDVELFVSDNCSQDETHEVVVSFINEGHPIIYSRNESNIGPDRNFLKCINGASGRYIWLIGDDDYLAEGIIKIVIDAIKNENYGLVHFRKQSVKDIYLQFNNRHDYLSIVDYFITFMTANIFSSDIVEKVNITSELMNSNLLQVAFYIRSACSCPNNLIINANYLTKDLNNKNNDNGNYNFFLVFIDHYLTLLNDFVIEGLVSKKTYNKLKRNIFRNFITLHILKILILKLMPKMQTTGAWRIILRYYWKEPYAYLYALLKIPYYYYQIKIKSKY